MEKQMVKIVSDETELNIDKIKKHLDDLWSMKADCLSKEMKRVIDYQIQSTCYTLERLREHFTEEVN